MTQHAVSTALAILHLDLVGYSRLIGADDEKTIREILEELSAVRQIIEQCGGSIHAKAGDSYLATFATLREAFDAAVAIHERRTITKSGEKLCFRLGLHIGDVLIVNDELAGNAVNIAARLEGIADPGGICISRAARDLASPKIRKIFELHGEVALKNIEEPLQVYKTKVHQGSFARAKNYARVPKQVVKPKILVRPLETLNSDPRSACFATGFTTDLISRLSRFRHLDVIGRASSFALDARTVDNAAAEKVDARYVAGGQLQIIDNRLRAVVMLTDAETGSVLWAERFDRKLDDFFEVQNEIEELTTSSMAVSIEIAEQEAARARDPENLDAYSLVVQGRLEDVMDGAVGEEATKRAMGCFMRAVDYDPNYSSALAGVAFAHTIQWLGNWTQDRNKSMGASTEYALRAIDADRNDARAHFSLGFVSLYRREHDRSLAAYENAMRLNPSDVEIMAEYADALKHNGEPEKAIPLLERALKLNPLRPDWYLSNLAHANFVLGDFETAVRTIRRMRQPMTAQRVLTASLMMAGRDQEGHLEAERLRKMEPNFSASTWSAIVPDRLPSHSMLLREGLERAGF
ncbi:tetratricopeptide repeat protein [uncultured Roseobacter sp.]|uniref:tetratricopeptide repeat protein n=1 Tax=uncultured Roseobacter sp. TaxID=114847 RepID=UPI002615E56D|nr:tetratricopeptide repeat protein [uncultured Roseobacter sp.]